MPLSLGLGFGHGLWGFAVWHTNVTLGFGEQKKGFWGLAVWVCVMGFKVMVHEWGLGECNGF